MTLEYLVSLDMKGIHDYIFGTNKLREIRGASVLLDRLNRETPLNELCSGKYGQQGQDWIPIVLGGGNIKVLFRDKAKTEKFKNFLEVSFRKQTFGSKVSVTVSEKNGDNDKQWLKRIGREIQREKFLRGEQNQIMACSFFKACKACGLYPAEHPDTRIKKIRYICKSCYKKIEESEKYKNLEIYKELSKTRNELKLPREFSEIGKESKPEGYMGFIYADANRMGEYLSKIKTFNDLENFSADIHKSNLDATVSAISNNFDSNYLPVQVILAGGDDLILALPADKAIDVAIDFCGNFNINLSHREISTSAAIVICHDSLPIKNILDVAESLLKNAKLESRNNGGGTYIDFIVTSGSALEDPILKRERELTIRDSGVHRVTKRPYSHEDIKILRDNVKALKKNNFPKNKLRMLYECLFSGHDRSMLDAYYFKTRLSERHRELMNGLKLDLFPWQQKELSEYTTIIADIVELYEFIH